jgi:hypothetical protein
MHHQVLIDDRPVKEKEKDFLHEELALGNSLVEYLTRKQADKSKKKYPIANQLGTQSCAAHSGVMALGIQEVYEGKPFKVLSPMFIYRKRKNFPSEGMYVHDVGDICRKFGACPFELLPTPKTEKEANSLFVTGKMEDEAKPYRSGEYFSLTKPIMDEYVRVCNNLELPIKLCVWGSVKEWSMEIPEILDPKLTLEKAAVRHLVTVLPLSGHTYRNKKYFIIQDSSHFGKKTHRYISEEWLSKRVVVGQYMLSIPNTVEPTPPPLYDFKVNLKVGDTGVDVTRVQEFLKSQGFFPDMPCTEYYGGLTRKGVEDFQIAHSNKILAFFGLTKPTGYWGEKTREVANIIVSGI